MAQPNIFKDEYQKSFRNLQDVLEKTRKLPPRYTFIGGDLLFSDRDDSVIVQASGIPKIKDSPYNIASYMTIKPTSSIIKTIPLLLDSLFYKPVDGESLGLLV